MIDENNTVIVKPRTFTEKRAGHDAFIDLVAPYIEEHTVIVAFEATGIYYHNIITSLSDAYPSLTFYRLNPFSVKKYRESELKRNSDDKGSARTITAMIAERWKKLKPYEPGRLDDIACVTDEMTMLKRDRTRLINRLHRELALANPEVEKVFDDISCAKARAVLSRYPTAAQLARAHRKTLAALRDNAPYAHRIGNEHAETLIQHAKTSIASDTSPQRARLITRLVARLALVQRQIATCEKDLESLLDDRDYDFIPGVALQDPGDEHDESRQDIALAATIEGVSEWGSSFIVSHTPRIRNFATFEKFNAFVGICPRYERSGINDSVPGKMSKRGSKKIRWVLYMQTLAAIRCNPVVRAYYHRHLSMGKPKKKAIAACMTKMLRLIYGVIKTRTMFDPLYNFRHMEIPAHSGQDASLYNKN
jgi:transposase